MQRDEDGDERRCRACSRRHEEAAKPKDGDCLLQQTNGRFRGEVNFASSKVANVLGGWRTRQTSDECAVLLLGVRHLVR